MSPDLKSVYAVGSDRTLKEINLNEATVSNSLLAAPAIVCIFKSFKNLLKVHVDILSKFVKVLIL